MKNKKTSLAPVLVVKGDRLEFFLLGLIGLAESLVHIFSLGFVTTSWRGDSFLGRASMTNFCHIERQRLDKPVSQNLNHLWFALDPYTGERMGAGHRVKAQIIKACKDSGLVILPKGMTPAHHEHLRLFALQHGMFWKGILKSMWARGEDANDPILRQVRTTSAR